jgi:hypothetical protein
MIERGEDHIYRCKGVFVPSVTQILDFFTEQKGKAFFKKEHAVRGRMVHLFTQLVDSNDFIRTDLSDETEGYLDAYEKFKKDTDPEWFYSEEIVFSPELWYAGTLDRLGIVSGKTAIVDFKTGPMSPIHSLQLAAYALAVNMSDSIEEGLIVELKKTGKYRINLIPLSDSIEAWMHLAHWVRWRDRNEGIYTQIERRARS